MQRGHDAIVHESVHFMLLSGRKASFLLNFAIRVRVILLPQESEISPSLSLSFLDDKRLRECRAGRSETDSRCDPFHREPYSHRTVNPTPRRRARQDGVAFQFLAERADFCAHFIAGIRRGMNASPADGARGKKEGKEEERR